MDKDDEHRKEEERRTMQAEKCKKDIEVETNTSLHLPTMFEFCELY